MFETLEIKPDIKVNRILLILGALVFIACYTYILSLFSTLGIDTARFSSVWLSFDTQSFRSFFTELSQAGTLIKFVASFKLNILSMLGFSALFFSASLLLARAIKSDSRLKPSAYLFPLLAVIVGLGDIIPSALLVANAGSLPDVAPWLVMVISGAYVARVIVLYVLLVWMLLVGALLLKQKMKS